MSTRTRNWMVFHFTIHVRANRKDFFRTTGLSGSGIPDAVTDMINQIKPRAITA